MSKKQKVNDSGSIATSSLQRKCFVSQSALSNILTDIRDNGLPTTFSRASMHRARVDLAGTNTPYGPLMDSLEFELEGKNSKVGTSVVVNRLNPCAFLFYICEHSPRYARLVLEALDRHPSTPSTPWNIIIYEDGVDPGDGLVKEKSRHSVIYYWAFKEFEMLNLCHEELWAAGFIVRTTIAKQYGLPSLTCRLLDSFHNDTNDMLTLGVVAFPEGRKVRIYAKVSTMFGDLPALCDDICERSLGQPSLSMLPECFRHPARQAAS
jgi:hypothetical protein